MWKPTEHSEGARALSGSQARSQVEHVSCHALYLVNLASRDKTVRENSLSALRATMATAQESRPTP